MSTDPADIQSFSRLRDSIKACTLCAGLPLGPRPIFQAHRSARILIAGQAPGRITHQRGMPFDDASGKRLRSWLGISRDVFYDATKMAIVPMGFCYPGTGSGGDLPPRSECAETWREPLLNRLRNIRLTLVIGRYAQRWHMPDQAAQSVTQLVSDWRAFWPQVLPLPHPSPRNNRWLSRNPFFEAEIVPALQKRVQTLLR